MAQETPGKHYRLGVLAGEIGATAHAAGEDDSPYVRTLLALLAGIGTDAPLGTTISDAVSAWNGEE